MRGTSGYSLAPQRQLISRGVTPQYFLQPCASARGILLSAQLANSPRDFAVASSQILPVNLSLRTLLLLVVLLFQRELHACIWDGDTLADEKNGRPAMAEAILGKAPNLGDPIKLRQRIAELKAKPRDKDPAWWNNLAGAHIRLGEPKHAVALLQTNVTRFPNDYGIHANLGTAYHLLGRYKEAEKEIARDLQINPEAHFGLEKYHLALLQYLNRNADYQFRHVFIDEFSESFLMPIVPHAVPPQKGLAGKKAAADAKALARLQKEWSSSRKSPSGKINGDDFMLLAEMVKLDQAPGYRSEWNLAANTNLQAGVTYMASLNPKQPACFVMLGVLCQQNQDLNLAAAAYEKAIALGSPQTSLLKALNAGIKRHVSEAQKLRGGPAVTESASPTPQKAKKR